MPIRPAARLAVLAAAIACAPAVADPPAPATFSIVASVGSTRALSRAPVLNE